MSTRTVLLLSLLVAACVTVLVVSTLANDQIRAVLRDAGPWGTARFGPPFGDGNDDHFGLFDGSRNAWRGIASAIASYVFLFLAGLLALFAFPRHLRVVRDAFGRETGEKFRLFGVGVMAALAIVFLIAIGLFSMEAFPLPIVLAAAMIVSAWGGSVALALVIGQRINGWAGVAASSPVFDLAIGVLVVLSLTHIPILGWIGSALLGAFALGAVIATRFGCGGVWSLDEFRLTPEATGEAQP